MWKIGCVQLNVSKGNVEGNYQNVALQVKKAAENGVDVVVLPEMWNTGYDLHHASELCDPCGERTKAFLSQLSTTYNVNIVGGSIAKGGKSGVENTMYISNRKGEIVGEYSKAHLFQLMDEHLYLKSGTEMGLFEIEGVPCGGNICYDIRFPEWFRQHVYQGAKVMFVVAQWPSTRIDHWETLLRARAIENQCFVIACNRTGLENGNDFNGTSLIIGPWGDMISKAKQEEIVYGEIDLNQVDEIRKKIPVFDDCRKELYENRKSNSSIK